MTVAAALPFRRSAMLQELRAVAAGEAPPFDVLVVGAGATGAGVALDAAVRGLRVALVERHDFGSGTSSKSSKMIHGGLRYLQAGDVRLVYEALRERQRLRRNAPHLVSILPFLIPVMSRDGVVSKKVAKALGSALWMYDLAGGWRIGRLHRKLDAAAAAAHFPTTHRDRLGGGFLYYDAAADDARLTLTIARTAATHGAVVLNRCSVAAVRPAHPPLVARSSPVTGSNLHTNGPNEGGGGFLVAVDVDGERLQVPARTVVNAAGVWADEIADGDRPGDAAPSIRPAKGVHLTIPWELVRNDVAVIIPVKRDKRSLFIVPWGAQADGTFSHAYIGTTDTDYEGPLDDPPVDGNDVEYVLTALNAALDPDRTRPVRVDDVTASWSGLRPLVAGDPSGKGGPSAKTADLSRRHRVESDDAGVIRILGGKLTTYREMAEDTVDVVCRRLGRRRRRPWDRTTRRTRLIGASREVPPPTDRADQHLWGRYGSLTTDVVTLGATDPSLTEPLAPGFPYLKAEVVYAARAEMATTIEDVLTRRTRLHLFDRRASIEAAPTVADLLAGELGWDAAQRHEQLTEFMSWSEHDGHLVAD